MAAQNRFETKPSKGPILFCMIVSLKKNIHLGFLMGRGCVESKNKTSAKRKSTTHCPPQTILGKQGALQIFWGKCIAQTEKTTPYLPGGTFFVIFSYGFSCDFANQYLPQNIQFLKILKSLVQNIRLLPD